MLATVAAGLALAGPAMAGDDVNLSGNDSATWTGGGTPGVYIVYPFLGCEGLTPADACDATLVNADDTDNLTITMTPSGAMDDFDMTVYPNGDFDAEPVEGTTGEFAGVEESVTIDNPSGTYLVEIVTYLSANGTFTAKAVSTDSTPPSTNQKASTNSRQESLTAYAAALAAARR